MTTPQQAEEFAKKAVQDYLNACNMQSCEEIGNALMKLASVTAVMMACAEGREIAAQRLEGTGVFIRKNGPQFPKKIVPVH